MSLLDAYSLKFVRMTKTESDDGEGGRTVTWEEGAEFEMPMAHDSSTEARVAEKEGIEDSYTFLPDQALAFAYHDVFKRVSDGVCFRVTQPSGETYTPSTSGLNRGYILAERWELTND